MPAGRGKAAVGDNRAAGAGLRVCVRACVRVRVWGALYYGQGKSREKAIEG